MSNNNSDTAPTATLTQRRSVRTGNTIAERVDQARKEGVDMCDVGWGRNKVVGIDKVLHVRAVRGAKVDTGPVAGAWDNNSLVDGEREARGCPKEHNVSSEPQDGKEPDEH